jgi:hypothetical protein
VVVGSNPATPTRFKPQLIRAAAKIDKPLNCGFFMSAVSGGRLGGLFDGLFDLVVHDTQPVFAVGLRNSALAANIFCRVAAASLL